MEGWWDLDACALVDALRSGAITPPEAVELCLGAIDASALNAVSHLDAEGATKRAESADPSLPFGGLPVMIKELDAVAGWPNTQGSLVFKERRFDHDAVMTARLRAAGALLVAQSTASEFGGINCTTTRLHGTTSNPWDPARTPGGSSGGSAAAVAGGLVPLASASDGGGSIRIPAGFTGLLGLKATFGRIPKGPGAEIEPLTAVLGCVSRSVRDTARFFDVCNGADEHDPFSLPRTSGWEEGLGHQDLRGLRVAVAPDLGCAVLADGVRQLVEEAAGALIAETGLERVEVPVRLVAGGVEWAMAGSTSLLVELGERYPACEPLLTPEILFALNVTSHHFGLDTVLAIERFRRASVRATAELFDQVDLVVGAANPDVAFAAEGPLPTVVDGVDLVETLGFEAALGNNGALTIPANTTGNPAVSVPAGSVDGLPVGLQVIGRHHAEPLLLDLALAMERTRPWPLTAAGAPS